MESLSQQTCVPCSGKASKVTEAELAQFKSKVPDWQVIEVNGERRLKRVYPFADFQTALAFTQQVGQEAENQGHHPTLLTEWGQVTVNWWTHAIGGLHHNDFIMAAKTDEIANHFVKSKS